MNFITGFLGTISAMIAWAIFKRFWLTAVVAGSLILGWMCSVD